MAAAPASTHRRWIVPLLVAAVVVSAAALAVSLVTRSRPSASTSGVVGSGVAATQARVVAPFTAIDLRGSGNVTVRTGGRRHVVVHADDNLLSDVTTHVEGSTLVVGSKPGSFTTRAPMYVEVTVPAVDRIVLSGSGNITGSGSASRLDVTLSGSGTIVLGELAAQDVRATLSGSGSIRVWATRSLDAKIAGSGAVFYRGHPHELVTSVAGSGAVVAAEL